MDWDGLGWMGEWVNGGGGLASSMVRLNRGLLTGAFFLPCFHPSFLAFFCHFCILFSVFSWGEAWFVGDGGGGRTGCAWKSDACAVFSDILLQAIDDGIIPWSLTSLHYDSAGFGIEREASTRWTGKREKTK